MSAGKILIVEDDEDLLSIVSARLRAKGYDVEMAADGAAALESFDREPPDLVLLDFRLPDIDGLSVLRILRAREPAVRVVMMTGALSLDLAELVLAEGACDLVGKPIDFGRLERAIEKVLKPALA